MPHRASTSLERALVRHALELLWILDDLPEEQIELETAAQLQDDIAALVDGLDHDDRTTFFSIAEHLAQEADPLRAARIREATIAISRTND